ncbi:hypothetical protein [uncultured Ferrimonas sp.]|uniref:hypothetical protein n=1 Tax=uncultured Ferrimonas sp. TaxID=432640 RepID=UPI0026139A9A|nr:hypothetical protein [uncultured Ferrimonas sp.]
MKPVLLMGIGLSVMLMGCVNTTVPLGKSQQQVNRSVNTVQLMEPGEAESRAGVLIDEIQANYCRSTITEPMRSTYSLIQSLKQQANQLGANSIVLKQCQQQANRDGCLSQITCVATAYNVDISYSL